MFITSPSGMVILLIMLLLAKTVPFLYHVMIGFGVPVTLHTMWTNFLSTPPFGASKMAVGAVYQKIIELNVRKSKWKWFYALHILDRCRWCTNWYFFLFSLLVFLILYWWSEEKFCLGHSRELKIDITEHKSRQCFVDPTIRLLELMLLKIKVNAIVICYNEQNLISKENNAWKRFRPVWKLNPHPLGYHCNAVPIDPTSSNKWKHCVAFFLRQGLRRWYSLPENYLWALL